MCQVRLWFLSTSLLLLRSVTSQTYRVNDSFCPPAPAPAPAPAPSTSYIVNGTVPFFMKLFGCEQSLYPEKVDDEWSGSVIFSQLTCSHPNKGPLIIHVSDTDKEFTNYFCGQQNSLVLQRFTASISYLEISFAAGNYKSSARLKITIFCLNSLLRTLNAILCLCSSTEPKCIALDKVCDGNQDCANGIDEPASCRPTWSVEKPTFNSNLPASRPTTNGQITNRTQTKIIVVVVFLLVTPLIVFCCWSIKKRKGIELVPDDATAQRNASRSTQDGENVGSGAAQRAASAHYDALPTGPTAPEPVGSVLAGPTATPQMVLVPASQLVQSSLGSQPVYAVPFTQSGGQPTFFSQPLASGDRPQYVAAYVVQPGSIGAQTVANGQGNLPVSLGATDSLTTQCPSNASAAAAGGGSSNQIDACPPPSYDEAYAANNRQ